MAHAAEELPERVSRLPGIGEALGIPDPSETPTAAAKALRERPEIRRLVIPLKPMVWQRSGFNKKTGVHYTEKVCRKRMAEIGLLWAGRRLTMLPPGPCGMRLTFLFEHADSHYNAAGHLKPEHVGTRPSHNLGDLDNLTKLVKDALNGVAYGDDTQVAEIFASKEWAHDGERESTIVELWPL
jgi:Holliday junction resolvase RusA-like endonuclease